MSKAFAFNFILSILLEENFNTAKRSKRKINRKVLILSYLKNIKNRKIPKNRDFLDTIKKYPNDVFREHFRMNKLTFKKLLKIVQPFWKKSWTGRPPFTLENALYVTLWKLANQCTYRDISDRFNMTKSSAYKLVLKVTKTIFNIRRQFIKWPSAEEFNQITREFQSLRRQPFPFVVGCVDGTHITIPSPCQNPDSYYNRKGTHSLILQAVCDAIFRDVYFGLPGRIHDAAVWSSSPLGKALATSALKLPNESFLLGDSAYPLTSYLMVPYKDNGYLSETQSRFNTILSKTRVCIEQAFGILKNKFRILKYLDMQDISHAKYTVVTCLCLHNFIINNEGINESLEEACIEETKGTESNDEPCSTPSANEAKRIRDNLANLFAG